MINNSTSYGNAYFELNYIRTFGVNSSVVVDSSGAAVTTGAGAATSTSSGSSATTTSGAAVLVARPAWLACAAGVMGMFGWAML